MLRPALLISHKPLHIEARTPTTLARLALPLNVTPEVDLMPRKDGAD